MTNERDQGTFARTTPLSLSFVLECLFKSKCLLMLKMNLREDSYSNFRVHFHQIIFLYFYINDMRFCSERTEKSLYI